MIVKYQLDIDEYRAVHDLGKEELARIDNPRTIPRVFLEYAAPILRNNLIAQLDGAQSPRGYPAASAHSPSLKREQPPPKRRLFRERAMSVNASDRPK